jgi:3'(2'), 5'-bisphosphate nucleotidase
VNLGGPDEDAIVGERHSGAESDARVAARVAEQAGELLLRIRETGRERVHPYHLGRIADEQAHRLIVDELTRSRPQDWILSEEGTDDLRRVWRPRVWIVDPLDGTREYSVPGRRDWAVHVALWEEGRGITAAAVSMPAVGQVYCSDSPWPLADKPRAAPVILVSGSKPPPFSWKVAEALGGELATIGSAGAKAMAVLTGSADAYLHAGGQWEWDNAAPAGVVMASGLHASRIDGSPLEYNRADPYLPDLLFCHPLLADPILGAISEFYHRGL